MKTLKQIYESNKHLRETMGSDTFIQLVRIANQLQQLLDNDEYMYGGIDEACRNFINEVEEWKEEHDDRDEHWRKLV